MSGFSVRDDARRDQGTYGEFADVANQWYGRDFCPHADAPCVDGCGFCGRELAINQHNHTPEGFPNTGDPVSYMCVCFNC